LVLTEYAGGEAPASFYGNEPDAAL
jgi:hypothetical protein